MTKIKNTKRKAYPLVSVILPVYNGSLYLSETIDSIISQTYKNIELIIVDDASTDNGKTWRIVSRYKNKYPKIIKATRLKKNMGCGGDAAANYAYIEAKGEFVARIDADDIALPDRIEKQLDYMLKHPDVAVLGTSAHVINEDGQVVGEKKVITKHKDIYKAYFTFHPMINPTVMVRKSKIRKPKNLYLNDNPTNNDYLTYIKRISQGAIFANLNQKLLYYRIHNKNDSLAKVRRTFKHSLVTRKRAVLEFGYRPNILSIIKLITQIIVVYTLPEKLVFDIYLLIRGIRKPRDYIYRLRLPIIGKLRRAEI